MDAKTPSSLLDEPSEERRPDQHLERPSQAEAEAAVRTLIAFAGDDPEREGLLDTPRRVAKAYGEFFRGYGEDAATTLNAVFDEAGGYGNIVLVRKIPFYSHCEHHMVPFIGHADIAYYPGEGVVGLSKLARIVDVFGRRLQMQERLTQQVADAIDHELAPRGVAVMFEAEHHCVSMRGVQKAGVSTITTSFTGIFQQDIAEQNRFLSLVRG